MKLAGGHWRGLGSRGLAVMMLVAAALIVWHSLDRAPTAPATWWIIAALPLALGGLAGIMEG